MPRRASVVGAGVVVLQPGGIMEWHSTDVREELLIPLKGWARVEIQSSRSVRRQLRLGDGQCLLLPKHTMHRVVNVSTKASRYLYITAPAK